MPNPKAETENAFIETADREQLKPTAPEARLGGNGDDNLPVSALVPDYSTVRG